MKKTKDTKGTDYAERLTTLSGKKWKSLLDVQRPYRWNLRRLNPGKTLDVGCGIGRNLENLPKSSVGVDHNLHSVEIAKNAGYTAFVEKDFIKSKHAKPNSYDSMLLAHVVEHMNFEDNKKVIESYEKYLKRKGKIIIICPQEKGYATDATHVSMYDHNDLAALMGSIGYTVRRRSSFPLPRLFGKIFTYNEFVVVAHKTSQKNA